MTYLLKSITFFIVIISFCSCGNNTKEENKNARASQDIITRRDTVSKAKNGPLTYVQAYDKALALWQIPVEEKNVKTGAGNAHIIICGPANAEPLVLLHGMNASSTMWYPNIKAFSENHRVYAIDFLLEPGKSQCEGKINNTEQVVNWYCEIFDRLQLKKFSIVGASRGGWLALSIALHDKSRINKIALLSPAQAFIWIRPKLDVLENITYSIDPQRKKLRAVLETVTVDVDKIDETFINQYYIATKEATMNKCILQMRPFSNKELRSLTMPVLVLIGDQDIINNDESLEKAKKLIPSVETETIKHAGHFLSIDQPEIVDKRILDFLNESNRLSAKK
jgi:pimeloyl-ACP methyl ester carboxylesterase